MWCGVVRCGVSSVITGRRKKSSGKVSGEEDHDENWRGSKTK